MSRRSATAPTGSATSPFLDGFLPPLYLGALEPDADGNGLFDGVVIGSGNRADPLDKGGSPENFMYMIKDRRTAPGSGVDSGVQLSQLGDVTSNCLQSDTPCTVDLSKGWRLMLTEPAPFGVIGAITPSTNPTSTIICNAIGMIAADNSVVFNAHPGAKACSAQTIQVLNQAIQRAGGPPDLLTCPVEPTIESAQYLMQHPSIRLLVVTGGPGVVREAMKSGKKAICAGPGNPPVVVDETADLDQAARNAMILEKVAQVYYLALTSGKEVTPLPQQMADMLVFLLDGKQKAEIKRKENMKKD